MFIQVLSKCKLDITVQTIKNTIIQVGNYFSCYTFQTR